MWYDNSCSTKGAILLSLRLYKIANIEDVAEAIKVAIDIFLNSSLFCRSPKCTFESEYMGITNERYFRTFASDFKLKKDDIVADNEYIIAYTPRAVSKLNQKNVEYSFSETSFFLISDWINPELKNINPNDTNICTILNSPMILGPSILERITIEPNWISTNPNLSTALQKRLFFT